MRIQDSQPLRASIIVKWLNPYNLRQVQYMTGHRFVSSAEKYKQSDLEDLKEAINKFHSTNRISYEIVNFTVLQS